MKTEEILRRAEEYRRMRDALGVYRIDLAGPAAGGAPGGLPPNVRTLAREMRAPRPEDDTHGRRDRQEASDRAANGAVRESVSG